MAIELDRKPAKSVNDQVAIAEFLANYVACDAAVLAIEVQCGIGYTHGRPVGHTCQRLQRAMQSLKV